MSSNMKIHELKCETPHFNEVLAGCKTFEVRVDDRDYQTGDVLHLRETNPENHVYRGPSCLAIITHVLRAPALERLGIDVRPANVVVMGVDVVATSTEAGTRRRDR